LPAELGRSLVRAGGLGALATLVLVLALVVQPVPVGVSLRAYAVALGAIVLSTLVASAGLAPVFGSTPLRGRSSGGQDEPRPPGLAELEHAVDFGLASGFDLHHRLRPLLRRIAAERLARAGIDMDRQPQAALALLGAEAWELLRPERPQPERRARGASAAALERIVAALEQAQ